jgi:aldehyde dehydrogenase
LIKFKLKQLDMSTIISRPEFKAKYDNYMREIRSPVNGIYFDVICPIDGQVFTQAAHSKEDVALAVDKAHEAFQTWEKLQLRSVAFTE